MQIVKEIARHVKSLNKDSTFLVVVFSSSPNARPEDGQAKRSSRSGDLVPRDYTRDSNVSSFDGQPKGSSRFPDRSIEWIELNSVDVIESTIAQHH